MQKTREFIATQICTVSTFKIILIFFYFTLIFCIFYIFIYNKVILQKTYPSKNPNSLYLSQFAFNANAGGETYQILLLKSANLNLKTQTLSFKNGDLINFKEGKLELYKPLLEDKITSENNILKMEKNQLEIEYNFNTLVKYFKEIADKNSFQSIIQKIQLVLEFKNVSLNNRKLEVDIFQEIQGLISFFNMILISFIFFSNMPPRSPVLMRFFSASLTVATIYIINIILIGIISKLPTLNSVLILTPSVIIFLIIFAIFITKKI
jgi:lipopolysaccharide export LptBFGC system permease protein LptF